ncbi:MAG TPA: mercury(II) reductase [Candidatus Dormibacteraeota bacterium]|nr:mercury(II) reductase [Candidatus Dormibacteraeota bacterium]
MATKQMQIEGMTCVHCEKTIREALASAGASNVKANWRQGRASLEVVNATNEQLQAAVEAAGYKVVSIEEAKREKSGFKPLVGDKGPDYDLVVIGSGSAAFGAAIRATDAGARVALMESNVVGGTCVNVGCIPSKAMLAPADAYFRAAHHPFAGIRTSANGFDLGAMVNSKAGLVDELRTKKYIDLAKDYGFTIRQGLAEFVDPESIECAGKPIRADKYIIATGASPEVPSIPGLKDAGYLTSTTALELRDPPKRLAVLGAGPVGLEMGQLFMRLGSAVTFITRREVASREELETSEALRAVLEEEGAKVVTNSVVTAVERMAGGRRVSFTKDGLQEQIEVDEILVATGRRPNTQGLGLEKAGIELTERQAIRVGDDLQTTNPRVWAAGDVTGHRQFVYVAAYEGNIAARNALEATGRKVDFHSLPRVIFTSPTFAAAGLTDDEANARGLNCECRVLPMSAVPRALVNRDTRGFMKIVAEAGTGKILGASMVADGAGDVIQSVVLAIQFGLTTDDVANTWAPYLTFAEAFKLASQTFKRDVSKLSCCAA